MTTDIFEKIQPHLEKLARLPKPARVGMLPAIAVLVLAVYGYFFYLPVSGQIDAARQQRFQLQRKLSEVRMAAANEDAVKDEIALLQRKLAAALKELPDKKELPVLLTDITSIGKSAGLDFKAFRPRDEVSRTFYAEVPIDIEFTGGFHDVATFFDQVSRLPRIVNIGKLEIAIDHESSQNTTLMVKGEATTFRFIEGQDPPGGLEGKTGRAARGRGMKATRGHRGGH